MTLAWDAALQPLRDALVAEANAAADTVRTAAEDEGGRGIADAQQRADAVRSDARLQGEQDAAVLLSAERAKSRRAARTIVLAAQRAAYDDLRAQARSAIQQLLADPAVRGRLEAQACTQLGADVTVRELPGGGFVAETPDGRTVDASVSALVDGALAGVDLEALWAP